MSVLTWKTESHNASESMPVGGHDVGLNVWCEDHQVFAYISRSDFFDENDELLKAGRLRIVFKKSVHFISQSLSTDAGKVTIKLTVDNKPLTIAWFCSVTESAAIVSFSCKQSIAASVTYENWRIHDHELPNDNSRWPCKGFYKFPGKVIKHRDEFVADSTRLSFWHQNKNSAIIDDTVHQQHLDDYRSQAFDYLSGAIFGGLMTSSLFDGCEAGTTSYDGRPAVAYTYSVEITDGASILVLLDHSQAMILDNWEESLTARAQSFDVLQQEKDADKFWHEAAVRSWIHLRSHDNRAQEISENYELFRYMLLCNQAGAFPTKFNGGLFTVDPDLPFVGKSGQEDIDSVQKGDNPGNHLSLKKFDPDFRMWGGIFTSQNQRLVYWPMLAAGDYDAMIPLFELYRRGLPLAMGFVKKLWGHRGAMFAEQLEQFGLSSGSEYGWLNPKTGKRRYGFTDPAELDSPYTRYYFASQIELSYMILRYAEASGRSITKYHELIKQCLLFFYDHYRYIHRITTLSDYDADGKLVIAPSTATESYKNAVNPTEVISGLRATVPLYLKIFNNEIDEEERTEFNKFYQALPELPHRQMQGHDTIAPASYFTDIMNAELPQLYPVFPYEQYGVGRPNLDLARDTWRYGVDSEKQRGKIGWHQDNIFVALLGDADDAANLTYEKLKNSWQRFPAFWGPGYDWLPDHNWGGTGMIGLQKMLVQETDKDVILLPACPKDWEGDVRMSLNNQATITFSFGNGQVKIEDYQSPLGNKRIIYEGGDIHV
ncbi:DUF5703 domain-containing protein [Lacticaseibacillus hegangensis]|uniref:DUF5703 domain-containing protein n=1 Tax=Lacticaseibacillus hegangensis TaxID=2486010 RepID=A0ABW4CWD1_9LACO|nr:DUF5703 domain-containing protein [Lacticaseibacillus hegangensis]